VPGADVCWAIVAMWQSLVRGEEETSYRISLPLAALLATQVGLDGYLAVEKHLLVRQKIFPTAARRPPLGYELDDVTVAHVETVFELLVTACERAGGGGPTMLSEDLGATAVVTKTEDR
jgi:hypothetical protein